MPPPKGERFEYEGERGERTEAIEDGLVNAKRERVEKRETRSEGFNIL